ncbi:MAG: acetoacetyl-CoA reductase [Gammaproteobacteria bacterium]|nr:acetoacetyl-CoA reductase [Gammaproteobacteria bacterium]
MTNKVEQRNYQRIALVSGGMGGIGTAICQALASAGNHVISTYQKKGDHEHAARWQEDQAQQGFDIDKVYLDISDADACRAAVDELLQRYEKIDILVNNAGITRDRLCHKMAVDDWQQVIAVNLNSVFYLTQPVLDSMMQNTYGRIINISSINAQKGQRGQVNYAAAKAGMHGFTKSLAQEVAGKQITVNTISPGYINTQMLGSVREDIKNQIIAEIPVGRLGEPTEVARVVAFLADDASEFITGSNIAINGGQYVS